MGVGARPLLEAVLGVPDSHMVVKTRRVYGTGQKDVQIVGTTDPG